MPQKKRGKKTATLRVIEGGPRKPEAPSHLGKREREIWQDVVSVHNADWLSKDQHPLLARYCEHVAEAEKLFGKIRRAKKEDVYLRLLAARERESRAITALARSLRLTNQSRYVPHSAEARPGKGLKPWEYGNSR